MASKATVSIEDGVTKLYVTGNWAEELRKYGGETVEGDGLVITLEEGDSVTLTRADEKQR